MLVETLEQDRRDLELLAAERQATIEQNRLDIETLKSQRDQYKLDLDACLKTPSPPPPPPPPVEALRLDVDGLRFRLREADEGGETGASIQELVVALPGGPFRTATTKRWTRRRP
jgi:hypothetical protein